MKTPGKLDARAKILGRAELRARLAEHRQRGERIVLANGCFDVLHVGHARYLAGAKREGDVLVLTLSLGDVGHAFPTGDLLRRLAITALAGDPEHPIAKRAMFLSRHFGEEQQIPGIVVRVVKIDDRLGFLGPESRTLRLTLPGSVGLPVRWRVSYQRVQHLGASESDAKIGGEIVVAEGSIPAP